MKKPEKIMSAAYHPNCKDHQKRIRRRSSRKSFACNPWQKKYHSKAAQLPETLHHRIQYRKQQNKRHCCTHIPPGSVQAFGSKETGNAADISQYTKTFLNSVFSPFIKAVSGQTDINPVKDHRYKPESGHHRKNVP